MRKSLKHRLTMCAVLPLLLAGCGLALPAAPNNAASSAAPTEYGQTSVSVPPTNESTAAPPATPTAYGQTSVSVPASALLPPDTIWIQSANVVLSLSASSALRDIAQRGFPASRTFQLRTGWQHCASCVCCFASVSITSSK